MRRHVSDPVCHIFTSGAVRALQEHGPLRHNVGDDLLLVAMHADDTDLISSDCEYLDKVQLAVTP